MPVPLAPSLLPPRHLWKGMALTAGVQFVLSYIPLFLQSQYQTYAIPFWPASGTGLAAVLLGGPWMLLGAYAGFVCSGMFLTPGSVADLALLATANIMEAGLAWLLLTRVAPDVRKDLTRIRDLGWFLLLAPWIPALVSSGWTQWLLSGMVAGHKNIWEEFAVYFLGNATGILLVTPFILVWQDFRRFDWRSYRGGMVAGLLVVLLTGILLLKIKNLPLLSPLLVSLLIPAALYGVWETGLRGSTILVLASSIVYFAFERSGQDSFLAFVFNRIQELDPHGHPNKVLEGTRELVSGISMQLGFLGLMAGTILPLGAVVDELRRKTEAQLVAMKALQNTFWTWSRDGGLVIESPVMASLFASPPSLFDPDQTTGSKHVSLAPGREPEFRSYWTCMAKDDQGRPVSVVGILHDLSLNRERDQALQKADLLDLEIQTLRSHLNPHLLFNCLTGLRGLIGVDPVQAREFANYLARFLREVVNSQSKPLIPIKEELKICHDFLRLEELRGRKVELVNRINTETENVLLPPLTLVTLLENATKHGEQPDGSGLRIFLESTWKPDGSLQIKVRQPGRLLDLAKQNQGSGLAIIRRQFERLMPEGSSIFLESLHEGWVEARISMQTAQS